MPSFLNNSITLSRIGVFIVGVLIVGYGIFEAHNLLLGPQITLAAPEYAVATHALVSVEGTAANTSWLALSGRPIHTDEQGNFSEKLLVPVGYSILKLEAKDRFGRQSEKFIRVVRTPSERLLISPLSATTSPNIPST